MKCLIVGGQGQLGRALQMTAPPAIEIIAPLEAECDLTRADQIEHWLSLAKPDLVCNAAAYTAVDKAESEPEVAQKINATAVGALAAFAARCDAKLVHISTDFVFDGTSGTPYQPDDAPNPLSVYGRTKRAGEVAALSENPQTLLIRTAWVYAEKGRNFVATMLRLFDGEDEIRVVADQIGTPTYARNLALAVWALAAAEASGIYHYTDAGVASWYDFAVAIAEEARGLSLIPKSPRIKPISTADYPTPAVRPRYSVLDKSKTWAVEGCPCQHWRAALRQALRKISENG